MLVCSYKNTHKELLFTLEYLPTEMFCEQSKHNFPGVYSGEAGSVIGTALMAVYFLPTGNHKIPQTQKNTTPYAKESWLQ